MCSTLCSSWPVTSRRHDGTDREVEPAVGESFVVMFEEQFASMRRENTIARCRAQLVSGWRQGNASARRRGAAHDTRRGVRAGRRRTASCVRRRQWRAAAPHGRPEHNDRLRYQPAAEPSSVHSMNVGIACVQATGQSSTIRGTRAGRQRRGEEGGSAQDDPRTAKSRLPRRTLPAPSSGQA
jgi:hypothetical protein